MNSMTWAVASPPYRTPFEVARDFTEEAPVDLQAMAAALGVSVDMEADLGPDVSGRICRRRDSGGSDQFRIEVNGAHPWRRRRFTLAHEIAHFLLHRDLLGQGIEDNEMYRSGLPDPIEYEANRFAAELLMPAKLVRTAYRSGAKAIVPLADAFDVSAEAMRVRLKELRLAP